MSLLSQSLRRFVHNMAVGSLGQVINLCAQVVAVPLFLHYWTKESYGEWLVLTSIPSLLWCFEGGLAWVASSRMTVAAAAGDWDLANALFQNVLVAQTAICAFILGGTLLFVRLTNVSQFFHFIHTSNAQATVALVLMICYMITGFYIALLRAGYWASERVARGIMMQNMWRTFDLVITILVIVFHGHAMALAIGLSGGALACLLLIWIDVMRICPKVRFGVSKATWKQSKELMVDGAPLLVGLAASALSLQGYPLVVNRVLGAALVVNFTAVRTVSRIILQVILLLSNSSGPEFSRTYGQKDTQGYLRLLKIVIAASVAGGILSCICLPLVGPWLIQEWSGGKIIMDRFTLLLFGITIALQGGWGVCAAVLVASNVHHLFNYLYFAFTVVAIAIAPYFIRLYGFESIPAVMIAADFSLLVAGVYLCHQKLTHISFRELYRIFHPSFYMQKAMALRTRMVNGL